MRWQTPWAGAITWLALAWMVGCAAGHWLIHPQMWLIIACLLAGAILIANVLRRSALLPPLMLACVVALGAAWATLTFTRLPVDHIARYMTAERQLVSITAVVDQPPRSTRAPRGALARFGYNPLATLYEIRVLTLATDQGDKPVQGRLLVRQPQQSHQIKQGQRVRIIGYLRGPGRPMNPGEMDFRAWLADRDLAGFLTLPEPDSWELLPDDAHRLSLTHLRAAASQWAMESLNYGLDAHPSQRSLLQMLLLGQRAAGLDAAETAFRRVGLAHILSISGAHLGIMVALLTLGMLALGVRPWNVVLVVLVTLAFYLLAVPPQVPVVRAAIMAAMLVIGQAMGRRIPRLDPLGLACIVVLIWRPHELVTPGFQLSFGVVAGLLCFTAPLAQRLWPQATPGSGHVTPMQHAGKLASGYVAANVVAFIIAAPLVAYHFQNFSPLTIPLSILTLPLITLVLAAGYLKIGVGLLLPGLGGDLAMPLWQLTKWLGALVTWCSQWRISFLELSQGPSMGWTLAAMAVGIAWLAGWFHARRLALTGSMAILAGWLMMLQMGYRTQPASWPADLGPRVAMRINFLSVGDGNCYLIRSRLPDGSLHVLMYDCGGRSVDGGLNTILPALSELGVARIDTMILSHADMDHFNASLDVIRRLPVGVVMVSPQMAQSLTDDSPRSAPAYLLTELRNRGQAIQVISQGWSKQLGGHRWEAIWPPAQFAAPPENDNDLSIVLSLHVAGRRVLLNGDIQKLAISAMLDRDPQAYAADVMDLPHHGSFVRGISPRWLAAVKPKIVVQSCGGYRVEHDPWASHWPADLPRLQTARTGMIELDVHHDGELSWRTFLGTP